MDTMNTHYPDINIAYLPRKELNEDGEIVIDNVTYVSI
jgi:hypothetical protein